MSVRFLQQNFQRIIKNKIQHNTNWLLFANFLVKPFWIVFLIFSTRLLGPENFGIFMYAISLIGLLLAIFEFGVAILSTKVVSSKKNETKNYIRYAFGLRLISYLIAITVLVSMYVFTPLLQHQLIVFTLLIYGVSNSLTIFFRSIFRGYEVMKYEAISIIIDRLLVITLCSATLLLSINLTFFVIAYSVAFFMSMIATFFMFKKQVSNPLPSFNLSKIREQVLRPGSVFAVMNLLLIIRSKLPSLMIEYITNSNVQIGFYNSGYRLLESYLLIPMIFITPLYPNFVRLFKRKIILSKLILNSTRLILFITSLFVIPFYFNRDSFTIFLYGEEFANASDTIGLLILSMFAMGLTVIFGSLVSATDRQKKANKIIGIEVIIGISVFITGISLLQSEGAAISTLIMEFLMAMILIYVSKDLIDMKSIINLIAKFIIAIIISSLIILLTSNLLHADILIIDITISVLILLIVHLLIGTISMKDLYRLNKFLPKSK